MSRQQLVAGIDVGSTKITTVIASVGADEEERINKFVPSGIKVLGVASVPSRGVRKGQIVNIEEVSEVVVASVEAAERMAGYSLTRAMVAIGGPHLASQNSKGVVAVAEPEGEISPADVERVIEAARAVSLPSSREVIHVIPRSFTVDGQEGVKDPVGMSGVRLEVETHLITGASMAMRNLTKCVSEVGADVQNLVASGMASAEAVLTETEKELGVVLLDIGGGVTNIVIFVEGSPFYTTVLPIGAKNVTNDLAIGLRLSLEAAEKIKLALGKKQKLPKVSSKEEPKEESDEIELTDLGIDEETRTVSRKTLVEGIIKPRLDEIFTMVSLEVKKSGAMGLTPAGVVIAGGGAQTVGVVEAAKKILSMPVRIGSPVGIAGLIDDVQTPDFATAIGLILWRTKDDAVMPAARFSFGQIGKTLQKIPGRGMVGRFTELIKSFLP